MAVIIGDVVRYNPRSLLDLSKKAVQETYKHHWNEISDIPEILQKELLEAWMTRREDIDFDGDDDWDNMYDYLGMGWDRMDWGPQAMIYIMNHPHDLVPNWATDVNHVIWDYYLWCDRNVIMNPCRRLCSRCFINVSGEFRQFSANYWEEKNWEFFHITNHTLENIENVLPLVWDQNNWCFVCKYTPCIKDFSDLSGCLTHHNYHAHHPVLDDDEIDYAIDYYMVDRLMDHSRVFRMNGNRMDSEMYKYIRSHKDFTW